MFLPGFRNVWPDPFRHRFPSSLQPGHDSHESLGLKTSMESYYAVIVKQGLFPYVIPFESAHL